MQLCTRALWRQRLVCHPWVEHRVLEKAGPNISRQSQEAERVAESATHAASASATRANALVNSLSAVSGAFVIKGRCEEQAVDCAPRR